MTLALPQEEGVQVTSDHVHHSQGRLGVSHGVAGKHSAATWRVGWGWVRGRGTVKTGNVVLLCVTASPHLFHELSGMNSTIYFFFNVYLSDCTAS